MADIVHPSTQFSTVFAKNQCAFIPYVMAGDPDLDTTRLLVRAVADAGAAAIELGVPYGDPLADGPTIAAAGARAVTSGVTISHALRLVAGESSSTPPIVLFTYFNPVYQYGIERFARDAGNAGTAGVIVPDIALEEGQELRQALSSHGINMPLLVAPSTPPARAAAIAQASTGFVYLVSRLGVTGAGTVPDFTPLREQVRTLRGVTDKPLAVGFGISRPEHVQEVRDDVDGFIVGSALIESYAGTQGTRAAASAFAFSSRLVQAARR